MYFEIQEKYRHWKGYNFFRPKLQLVRVALLWSFGRVTGSYDPGWSTFSLKPGAGRTSEPAGRLISWRFEPGTWTKNTWEWVTWEMRPAEWNHLMITVQQLCIHVFACFALMAQLWRQCLYHEYRYHRWVWRWVSGASYRCWFPLNQWWCCGKTTAPCPAVLCQWGNDGTTSGTTRGRSLCHTAYYDEHFEGKSTFFSPVEARFFKHDFLGGSLSFDF